MPKNKIDLRIVKTKKKLTEALFSLLEETSYEQIKISDLCEKAGVSRATFYNNFLTIDDVLAYYFKEAESKVVDDFISRFKQNNYSFSSAYRLLVHDIVTTVSNDKNHIISILSKNTFSQVYMGIQTFNNDCIGNFLNYFKDEISNLSTGFISSYLAGASTGVLFYLLQHPEEIKTEEEIEKLIIELTTPILNEVTHNTIFEKSL